MEPSATTEAKMIMTSVDKDHLSSNLQTLLNFDPNTKQQQFLNR